VLLLVPWAMLGGATWWFVRRARAAEPLE